jgi:hypothetical protein
VALTILKNVKAIEDGNSVHLQNLYTVVDSEDWRTLYVYRYEE